MLLGHELSQPWRAMRFERATGFGTDLRGLFLHVELIQPRRTQPGLGRRNDAQAPTPGFSDIQYDRLALIYMIASVRSAAGRFRVSIAIDSGIRGGHDDPQNFGDRRFRRQRRAAGELVYAAPCGRAGTRPRSSRTGTRRSRRQSRQPFVP